MRISAVLFDLDGTLLDTLNDLGDSMNAVLERMGFPVHKIESYKAFVGDGMKVLAERVLPGQHRTEQTITQVVESMRTGYGARWHEQTRSYDGIPALLDELRSREIRMAVLSNKPDDFTREIVAHYFGDVYFEKVLGAGPFPHKPDPSSALYVASAMSLDPGAFLYVGDTGTDMQTAVRARMYPVGALWGFRTAKELKVNGAAILVSKPQEISGIVQNISLDL